MKNNKKIFFILLFLILYCLCSSGSVGDVITDNARNHIYKTDEKINFYDNVDSRDLLGSLTFVSAVVVKNENFKVKEISGYDESGAAVYKEVLYSQLIQVNYEYKNAGGYKIIDESCFVVYDETGASGKINPDINEPAIAPGGEGSFMVALLNESGTADISIFYSGVLSPNAKARLDIGENHDLSRSEDDISDYGSESIETSQNEITENVKLNKKIGFLYIIIIGLSVAVVLLAVIHIRNNKCRNK